MTKMNNKMKDVTRKKI